MGCTPQQSPAEPETTDAFAGQLLHGSHRVVLKTSLGDITLKLDADAAPKTVTNFVALAQTGYYNGLTFHRVIPDFMIQGGDPEGNGTGGESIFGVDFEDEISAKSYTLDTQKLKDVSEDELPAELQEMTLQEYYELQGYRYRDDLKSLPMDRGALAMANSGPNTNGSQFFIIQREGGTPWLEGRHTVFGVVVEGMDVVDAIANVERGANDQPLTPVTFSVEIL
ncbi:peptidylprolyl isomerase [Candidatus Peregrinibacteria bacterium CG10_big_fil_rev_8_21_14_0_10_55_24]|nr:MAG: peptidylprolyl isomerase [Candidatus Peregrinibacteria bacterium CG10_big_fil_rev_8_21_14_0_10_55_24]